MINKAAINQYVKSFKPMSSDSCQEYQKSNNISEWHLDYFEKIDSYRKDNDMTAYYATSLMIKVSSLNYKTNYRYKSKYIINKNIQECVNENYIYPFLLFINDKFIKWDNIFITNTYKNSFITIDNLDTNTIINKLKIYNIPFNIEMHTGTSMKLYQNAKSENIDLLFSFDASGNIVTDYKLQPSYTSVYLNNKDERYIVDFKYLDSDYPPNTVYKNEILYISNDISSVYNIMPGNIIFIDKGVINLGKQISVLADNTILIPSDTDISNENKTGYVLIFDTNNSNNINNIKEYDSLTSGKYSLFDDYTGDSSSASATILNKKFSLDLDDESVPLYAKLLEYNSKLYNNIYLNDSVFSRVTTNTSLIKANNVINGLDHRDKYNEMGVLIFKGGNLVSYETNDDGNINLISDLSNPDNDVIEFIRFNSIQNHVLGGKTPTDSSSNIEITNILDNNDINFSAYIDTNSDITTKYKYPIPIYLNFSDTTFTENNGSISMNTSNESLFDKRGVFYNSNQFRHCYKKVTKDIKDRGYISLPDEFNTCSDPNRYMVFYNGLMLSKDNDVVLSLYNDNKPYYEQRAYPVHSMNIDDRIDIFYIPYKYNEYVYNGLLNITGDINIDINNIKSPICKDLLLIFINGQLISNDKIIDIDKTTIRILNSTSVKHLCIISFINYDNDLLGYIKTTDSDIDKIAQDSITKTVSINGTEYNKYNYLKDISAPNISDTDPDVHDNSIGPEYAWMSITRDFYNASSTNISHHLFENTIDGSDIISTGIDSEENTIIPAYDARLEDINYDIYESYSKLSWVSGPKLNSIKTAIGIGNNINDTLAIHNKANIQNRLVEYFNGDSWSNKQNTTMANIVTTGCGITNNCISLVDNYNVNLFNGSSWSSHSKVNSPRHGSAVIGKTDSAIITGGGNSIDPTKTTEILVDNIWKTGSPSINIERHSHSGCGSENSAMIVGGNFIIEAFDGKTWSLVNNLNTNRFNFGCNGIMNNFIAISGQNYDGVVNTVEVYDGNTCSVLNTVPNPKYMIGSSGSGLSSMMFSGITSSGDYSYDSDILKRI